MNHRLLARRIAFPVALSLLSFARLTAQTPAGAAPAPANEVRVFHIDANGQNYDSNSITSVIQNTFRDRPIRVTQYFGSQDVVVSADHQDMQAVSQLISELNQPRKTFRLNYTVTELDGSKRIGLQRFAVIIVGGGRSTLKNGSKVPVLTGSYNTDSKTAQTQYTYLDVGMNFDATVNETAGGLQLKSKVEQSSVAEEKVSGMQIQQDPIVRQAVIEGTSYLVLGKPLMLGSLDIVGSTRHLDVEVMIEAVK